MRSRQYWRTSNQPEAITATSAEKHGWRVYRNGWPDFLMTRGDQIVGIEVKLARSRIGPKGTPVVSRTSQPTREQRRIHRLLRRAGIPVHVVRVDDFGAPVEWDQTTREWTPITWAAALTPKDGRPGRTLPKVGPRRPPAE